MDHALPGGSEASYRLLGLQALVHDGGVILKRGTARVFLEGEDVAELVDLLVERLAGGRPVALGRLVTEIGAGRRDALLQLVETLKAHRFLTSADGGEGRGRKREDVFFWNYQTTFDDIVGELAEVHLTVFGVNTIGLALLGNLRGCGFRNITFVDHPALRNIDYYDSKQRLRREISGALSAQPVPFDDWRATNADPGGCLVVCCDFGGRPLMRDWNRFAVDRKLMFYPVVLLDHIAHLGPLVRPGEGPCYECLWVRQDANMADPALVRAGEVEPSSGQQAIGYLQPMARAAADFAAIDLLKAFSRSLAANPVGRMIEIDLLEPRLTNRGLVRVPGCPACATARGDAAAAAPPHEETPAVPETAASGTEPAAATQPVAAGTGVEPARPDEAGPAPETAAAEGAV